MSVSKLKWPDWIGVVVEDLQTQRLRGYHAGFAVEDITSVREELVARGVEPMTGVEGGPEAQGYWCYFRDPEGNIFEISQRLGEGWSS